MKKLALFSVLLCLCGVYTVPAFATCGAHTLGFDGNQDPDDDEFLYENKRQFDLTMQGYNNSNEQNSGEGKGIECDTTNSAGCDSGHVIELLPGHVFKGSVVNAKRKYQCTSTFFGDDMWEVVGGFCETQWGNLNIGQSWKNKTTIDCSGLNKTENNVDTVELWEVICREGGLVVCKPTKCKKGYKLDAKNGKCTCDNCGGNDPQQCTDNGKKYNIGQQIPHDEDCKKLTDSDLRTGKRCQKWCYKEPDGNINALWGIVECPENYHGINIDDPSAYTPKFKIYDKCVKNSTPVDPGRTKTCKEKRSTAEGKACCDLSESEAEYKDGKCNCLDKNTEFKIVDGKGQCVAKEVTPVVEGECEYYFTGQIQCANGNQYFEKAKIKLPKSEVGKECGTNILKEDITRVMDLMKKLCEEKQPNLYIQQGPTQSEITSAQNVLSAFTSKAKDEASVWKTAEGKFNTTRLASDITAGVVLGTVGGVITGNIIKKNQVKKGFEALHCTVGGQKVADWGDEFSVGLQR